MNNISEKRNVIETFQRALDQSAFVLKENPELTFLQIYNRAQWKTEKNKLLKNILDREEIKFKKPWLKLISRPAESSAYIRTLTGHTGSVNACKFSPDGKKIVSASNDKTLKIWDVETGKEITTLRGHTSSVEDCAFSPDGKKIISRSYGNTLKIWDAETGGLITLAWHTIGLSTGDVSLDNKKIVSENEFLSGLNFGEDEPETHMLLDAETGEELATLSDHGNIVNSCGFSPDGEKIITGSRDNALKLWNSETGRKIASLSGHTGSVNTCAFSSDGKRIVSASFDRTLKIWNAENGRELFTLKGHNCSVIACAFSPYGTRILSEDSQKTIILWDAENGHKIATLQVGYAGYENRPRLKYIPLVHAFSSDNRHLIFARDFDKSLELRDAKSGKMIATLIGHPDDVYTCAFSPDSKKIVSGSNGLNNNLKLWDTKTGEEIATLSGHNCFVNCCAFSPDGRCIVSASDDKTLKIWDAESREELSLPVCHTNIVNSCAFSPDGRRIVSSSDDKTLKLWDAGTGEELSTLTGHPDVVQACAFSPDGRRIFSGGRSQFHLDPNDIKNVTKLWDTETEIDIKTFESFHGYLRACAFSPDGKYIVSAGNTMDLNLWDAEAGYETDILSGHGHLVNGCIFSPDGSYVVSASNDRSLKIWLTETIKELHTLTGHPDVVNSCAISPDGKKIVSGSNGFNNNLKLWNTKSGEELSTLEGHTDDVNACTFSPDSKHIISASRDKTLKLWDVRTGKELTNLKGYTSAVNACALSPDGRHIVLGDHMGCILLLSIENVKHFIPYVTSVRIKIFGKNIFWENNIKTTCKLCGKRFPVSDDILDLIRSINRNAGITPDQSPCLNLPDEAWDDPVLISECPLCHKPLKFNPFIVDNKDK